MQTRRFLLICWILAGLPTGAAEAPVASELFELQGNEAVATRKLEQALSRLAEDIAARGVDTGAVDDGVYELLRYYRSIGYLRAQVRGLLRRENGKSLLSFKIEEGPLSLISGVEITGNRVRSREELEECFSWRTTGPLGLGDKVFTEESLALCTECVVTRYQLDGYYFAEVQPAVSVEDDGRVRVLLEVTEGQRFVLAGVPGLEGVTAVDPGELEAALDLEARPAFVPRLPLVLKGKILDFYRQRGYLRANVEVDRSFDASSGEAHLTFRIQEGQRIRIRSIVLQGNERTWDHIVRQRIKLEEGALYNEALLGESYRSLLRSGLFSSVNIETARVEGNEEQVDLVVRVKEKPRYQVSFLTGWGSYELLRGAVVLEDANLFGTGHRLRLEGRASFVGEGVEGSYLNPYFFSDRLSHTVQGSFEHRQHPSFVRETHGGESGITHAITDQLRTSVLYRLRESDVVDVDQNVPPELVNNVLLSTLSGSVILDTRNSIVDPDRGFSSRVTVEYSGNALGSELDFLRYTAFASIVIPLPASLRLVGAARAGLIDRLAGTETIPIQERFFNGGEYTIRSYREDEAGDRVGGDPIGGETFTCTSLELRCPLPVLDGLQTALFFDSGTLTQKLSDFGGSRYFLGLGVGLRYNTPVGPFRFDVAWNPDRDPGEDEFAFHLGVGYPF